jgi:hypothetical protein
LKDGTKSSRIKAKLKEEEERRKVKKDEERNRAWRK